MCRTMLTTVTTVYLYSSFCKIFLMPVVFYSCRVYLIPYNSLGFLLKYLSIKKKLRYNRNLKFFHPLATN